MFTNSGFYILWALLAVFPLLIAIVSQDNALCRILLSILALVVSFAFAAAIYNEHVNAVERWNDGIHIECGGTYQFAGATRSKTSTTYYYTCDKCGHTESFPAIMK